MNKNIEGQYAIVGGGLSGTILAWELYFRQIPFVIFDDFKENTSSKVAPGTYNPIVFKRFISSWRADDLINCLNEFYSKIEYELKIKFHYKVNILKIINNDDEIKLWKKKTKDEPNNYFMEPDIIENKNSKINAPYGFGKVVDSGYINTNLFLEESHNFFRKYQLLRNYKVSYSELENNFLLDGIEFKKVIFAEGYLGENNLFFPNLKYNFAKGEVLELEIKDLKLDNIISKNMFLLPIGNDRYYAGSTFKWHYDDDQTTPEALEELLDGLSKIINCDIKVINQKAGIRPATYDRRPFLGESKVKLNVYSFNGMGAKTVMLAPYCAKLIVDNILFNTQLPIEVDIKRLDK